MLIKRKRQKVMVAMSGGVDSSVAAALLQQQGYQVIGAFMHFWFHQKGGDKLERASNVCCSKEAERNAREVASQLKIPFYVFHFEKQFKKAVVDNFLVQQKKGQTPNPCVVCNEKIKLGLLLTKALALGNDYLATGHYTSLKIGTTGQFYLLASCNVEKDQSYFLWKLKQKQLKHLLFPVGGFSTKAEVRVIARKLKLKVAESKESQDICFLGNDNLKGFLETYLKPKIGKIVTLGGEVIGQHNGLCFYTLGQRKGIEIPIKKEGLALPWFVVGKDIKKNTLIVSQDEKDLLQKELVVSQANWILGCEPSLPLKVKAKIRYRSELVGAVIQEKIGKLKYKVVFQKPQRAITPGQSVVWYLGDELVGGGIIVG